MKWISIKQISVLFKKISWTGKGTVIKNNYMILYSGHKSDKYEFGTGFILVNILG